MIQRIQHAGLAIVSILLLSAMGVACGSDEPDLADRVDQATDEMSDRIEEAGDAVSENLDEAKEEIRDEIDDHTTDR